MNAEVKKEWVKALRSGEFEQARGKLRDKCTGAMCCLGVLCELHRRKTGGWWEGPEQGGVCMTYHGSQDVLPRDVQEWAGLKWDNPWVELNGVFEGLAKLNDNGKTFAEIADLIERGL